MPDLSEPGTRVTSIPKGIAARVGEAVRYMITGAPPSTWFGPLQPIKPVAPEGTGGRAFDYPVGYNLQYQPRYTEALSHLDAQYGAHKISAAEKHDLERELTFDTEQQVLARFDAENAGLVKGSQAWARAMKEREALVDGFAKRIRQQDDQVCKQDSQAWNTANREILSAEDGLVRDILSKRQSLGRDLLQMAGRLVEQQISLELRKYTEELLLAVEHRSQEEAVEKGGLLSHLLFNQQETQDVAKWLNQQTGAVAAAVAQQTALKQTGAAQGLAAQAEAGSSVIMNDAYQAAAGAYAAVAQIPYVGPFLAPAAAAATFAAVVAFDSLTSLDVGAWELPHDMPAMLHKGEMVVPQNFASGLRANAGTGGSEGVTFNTHYYPTINMRDATTLRELLQKGGSELFDAVQRGYRIGLPMRPSMARSY